MSANLVHTLVLTIVLSCAWLQLDEVYHHSDERNTSSVSSDVTTVIEYCSTAMSVYKTHHEGSMLFDQPLAAVKHLHFLFYTSSKGVLFVV